MSIRKYTAFVKVAELKSITKAAEELNVTQSGVTQLINALEKDLNVSLFNRNRQGAVLTKEGEVLYPLIREVLRADSKVIAASKGLNLDEDKIIRIGTFTSVAVNWLPDIIKAYKEIEPNVKFEFVECGYNNIEESLRTPDVDFAFVPMPNALDCKCVPIYKDRLLALLPKDHPLAGASLCPMSIFENEDVISLIDTVDRDAKNAFAEAGIRPNIRYAVKDDYAMIAMVEKGLGISIIPELFSKEISENVITCELDPPSYRTIGLAFPSYEHLGQKAKAFAEYIKNWVNK